MRHFSFFDLNAILKHLREMQDFYPPQCSAMQCNAKHAMLRLAEQSANIWRDKFRFVFLSSFLSYN